MCCGNLPRLIVPEVRQETVPTQNLAEASEKRQRLHCSHCGATISPHFTWCPQCGRAIKDYPCAYCGQMVSPEAAYCEHCGAPARASVSA